MSSLDEIKKAFLRLLDEDEEVRGKLKEVTNDGKAPKRETVAAMPSEKADCTKPDTSAAELAETKKKAEAALAQKEEVERLCEELKKALRTQQETHERERSTWETEYGKLQKAQKAAQDAAVRWEQACGQKEQELQAALEEKSDLQTKHEQAKKDLKKAQARLAEQEEALSARFPRGWELFMQYPRISAATRERLTSVFFHEEDFASFICCGAQFGAPKEICDIMKSCWEKNAKSDLQILQKILVYCIELVNRSRRNNVFALIETKPGDKYDHKIHLLEPSSKAQGKIRQVCVPGFRNIHTGKAECEALVNLE